MMVATSKTRERSSCSMESKDNKLNTPLLAQMYERFLELPVPVVLGVLWLAGAVIDRRLRTGDLLVVVVYLGASGGCATGYAGRRFWRGRCKQGACLSPQGGSHARKGKRGGRY